jgi:hypothetical protein
MEISKNYNLFICYRGIERSKAAKEALIDANKPAGHYEGGMYRLATRTMSQVALEIPVQSLVTLISDPTDSPQAKDAKDKAVALLSKLVEYKQIEGLQVVDTNSIYGLLYGLGVNPEDYFTPGQ